MRKQEMSRRSGNGFGAKLRIGLLGIGLDAYWEQFAGLKARLEGYVGRVEALLRSDECELVNVGLIDSAPAAIAAGHALRRADVDVIFLYVTTYALSSTVLPLAQRARVPVIVLNLQPEAGHRLRGLQPAQGPDGDDRGVAGVLLCMPRSGDRERLRRGPEFRFTRSPACWMTIPGVAGRSRSGVDAARVAQALAHEPTGAAWATTTAACWTLPPT